MKFIAKNRTWIQENNRKKLQALTRAQICNVITEYSVKGLKVTLKIFFALFSEIAVNFKAANFAHIFCHPMCT